MIRAFLIIALLAIPAFSANSNKVDKTEKEKKVEHSENKIVVKSRDKGSNAPWKTEREYPLMFKNNRKGRSK